MTNPTERIFVDDSASDMADEGVDLLHMMFKLGQCAEKLGAALPTRAQSAAKGDQRN